MLPESDGHHLASHGKTLHPVDTYEVITATKVDPHRHVTRLGTSDGKQWAVDEMRAAIFAGDRFHTRSASTKRAANVVACLCRYCGFPKVRSAIDAASDSNLDTLPDCK
jgi:hypothetical protein